MNRFFLVLGSVFYLEGLLGVQLPVTIHNDTDQVAILKDFNFRYSSISIGPRKVNCRDNIKFCITPIAGREKESFHIVVGNSVIPIVLTWIKGKGIGPFINQVDTPFRALKSSDPSAGIQIRIVNKDNLLSKDQVIERSQQGMDLQDLSEQTGFTQEELENL